MPVPRRHIVFLGKRVRDLDRAVRALRKAGVLKGLAQALEIGVKLGKDRKVLAALNELEDNADVRRAAIRNPRAYVRRKRITLFKGAKVAISESSPLRIGVSGEVGGHSLTLGYDTDGGWFFQIDGEDVTS